MDNKDMKVKVFNFKKEDTYFLNYENFILFKTISRLFENLFSNQHITKTLINYFIDKHHYALVLHFKAQRANQ